MSHQVAPFGSGQEIDNDERLKKKKKEQGITVSSLKIFLAGVVNSYVGIDRENPRNSEQRALHFISSSILMLVCISIVRPGKLLRW